MGVCWSAMRDDRLGGLLPPLEFAMLRHWEALDADDVADRFRAAIAGAVDPAMRRSARRRKDSVLQPV
jgi:hypothetical protein